MSVHLIVTLHAREDRRDDFAQLMAAVKQDLPSAPGCRGVRLDAQEIVGTFSPRGEMFI